MNEAESSESAERIGAYTVLAMIGEGSMGRTYRCRAEDGATVALKVLFPSRLADWKDHELFEREAAILRKLQHSQIPGYVDAFVIEREEGLEYVLVQTFIEGRTLRAALDDGKRFEESELIRLLRWVLLVLKYLQNCAPPVVHRDVKPDNIILDERDRPNLVDFGAVREVVRLTMGGGSTVIGTYGYMPPEQLMGRGVPATDLYALGVTMVECLTRQTPNDLRGDHLRSLVEQSTVSDGLKRVLLRLCAPALEDRYALASDVLDDLDELEAGRALVHAATIEASMEARQQEHEQVLAKLTRETAGQFFVASMGVITLVTALFGVYYFVVALTANFELGFLLAIGAGLMGLFTNLVLLVRRYEHDSWEPPTSAWLVGDAEILHVGAGVHTGVDGNVGPGVLVEYGFLTPSGRREFSAFFPRSSEADFQPAGTHLRVYYQRHNPTIHELQDPRLDAAALQDMERLFDPRVPHTPE